MGRKPTHKNANVLSAKPKLKKDPGIPKLPDLKRMKSAQKEKELRQSVRAVKTDPDSPMASEPTLSSLALMAESSGNYEDGSMDPSSSTRASKVQSRKHYIRTLHKVIEESDIVILVLDARDPEGCRSRLVEEEVRRREHEGKKLVFVLNKIDLVPRSNAEAWLRYLRHSTPTLPFKSSTQQQRMNLTSRTSPALLNLLKGYKKGAGSITVGVVGYPNVGKSSLINSLRRAKVCAVAAEAGHTKEMQSVQVERGVRILDSPGVVFDDDDQGASNLLLRNVVKVDDIPDPIAVVEQILLRTEHETLRNIYKLPHVGSILEFLTMLALSTGRLHKGGTPDILSAAKQVIQDWNSQKIPFFSVPPNVHPSSVPTTVSAESSAKYGLGTNIAPGAEDVGQAQIVTQLGPAFDLGGLFNQADAGAFGTIDAEMMDGEQPADEPVEMESDDLTPSIPRKRSRSLSPAPSSLALAIPPSSTSAISQSDRAQPAEQRASKRIKKDPPSYDVAGHVRATVGMANQNPLNRRALKKNAKRSRKAERKAGRTAGGGMDIDDEAGGLAFTFMAGSDGVIVS
ncbi:hypothetical protein BD410DRAFT_787277 [Rickenella mellea]|uniref:CP-type G domain-containing protein n=1 Tax=Rickenella mellea TaxID=50990 RepID=A0A4Y7Q9F6_9AGAM|nr:hypothetical protein BD410DRAFT_787277 [Rickenella mellea]